MSILAGALGLVVLQTVLSSSSTAPRLGQLGTVLSTIVARWTDPTVPLVGSTHTAHTTAQTTAGPAGPPGGVGTASASLLTTQPILE